MNKEKVTKNAASYLDDIGSGHDAVGYDKEQVGKSHEEEVAKSNNWTGDKRDPIGRAAYQLKTKRLARKLKRLATELDAVEAEFCEGVSDDVDEAYADELMKAQDDMEGEVESMDEPEDLDSYSDDELSVKANKESSHATVNDKDDPQGAEDVRTGDEWIDIGPGSFDDKRDDVNRASS